MLNLVLGLGGLFSLLPESWLADIPTVASREIVSKAAGKERNLAESGPPLRVHAEGVIRQHSVLGKGTGEGFWGRVLGKGSGEGFLGRVLGKGSEKGAFFFFGLYS